VRKVRVPLPTAIAAALATLGADLRNLRLRRQMPMTYAAERVAISRSTLYKIERGDPSVSLGIYAALLHSYGLLMRVERLADAQWDRIGQELQDSRLPKRVHSSP
jgi:transcriptional regulator with XRE-family HTH domain